MIVNWRSKTQTVSLLGVLFIIFITPFIYAYYVRFNKEFWDNAMGNMLATVLALIAGIPIALWIDRRAKSSEENQKRFEKKRREKEILRLIKEELDFSYNSLFLAGKKGNISSLTVQPLKSDLWEALVASEETKYVDDPNLLNRISSAYYILKTVKNIEWQAHIALRTSSISFTFPDGSKKNSAQILLEDARGFDNLFESSIKEALDMINSRLNALEKYEK